MSLLSELHMAGALSPLSVAFARFVARHGDHGEDDLCTLTAALLSESNQRGDVCIDLAHWAGQALFAQLPGIQLDPAPDLQTWREALQASACVSEPGALAPMLLDGTLLYLHRFWQYEVAVFAAIDARLGPVQDLDLAQLQAGLQRLFAKQEGASVDWQKLASALALSRRFAVISGGPGTGKTTTAVKVLALLLEQSPTLRIRLAAPTGKAAARMVESIRAARQRLNLAPQIVARLPDEASTLHRLLGYQGGHGARGFRHHAQNPLHVDCLLIDEASMIDLPLMWALLQACRADTRIILLGDRDQLASVEAGNVLGDITGHGQALHYTPAMANWLQQLGVCAPTDIDNSDMAPAIADSLALLRTSHRFAADSGIGSFAAAVNAGDTQTALRLLSQGDKALGELVLSELLWLQPREQTWQPLHTEVLGWAVARYRPYLLCEDAGQALAAFAATRILCAAHEGALGERELNRQVGERLRLAGLMEPGEQVHGTPIMVTVNDYEMGLFNGDIGLLWRNAEGGLDACFPELDGQVRRLPAGMLPEHVTAWAMTVHKAQGSEFDEVLLILPSEATSALLLRELVYTGITRAKTRLLLHSSAEALTKACRTPVQRSSGLAARLGWRSTMRE
jgi:exodeoxyribonuclease V alpha subunit